jgi:hypothetical protein
VSEKSPLHGPNSWRISKVRPPPSCIAFYDCDELTDCIHRCLNAVCLQTAILCFIHRHIPGAGSVICDGCAGRVHAPLPARCALAHGHSMGSAWGPEHVRRSCGVIPLSMYGSMSRRVRCGPGVRGKPQQNAAAACDCAAPGRPFGTLSHGLLVCGEDRRTPQVRVSQWTISIPSSNSAITLIREQPG